jgi:hypothetical protein
MRKQIGPLVVLVAGLWRPVAAGDAGVGSGSLAICDAAIRDGRSRDALLPCQRAVAEGATSARAHDLLAHALLGCRDGRRPSRRASAPRRCVRARPDAGASNEYPFEAVVIYPAAPSARLLSRQAIGRDVPGEGGLTPAVLWSAVDVDGDGRADAEIFRFCCEKPTRPTRRGGPSPCESDCEKTFVRGAGDAWTLAAQKTED